MDPVVGVKLGLDGCSLTSVTAGFEPGALRGG